jgi:hypothetical protein
MSRVSNWCLRLAGWSGLVNGLGFGGFAIPAIWSIARGHGVLYTFGNPTYGDGPLDQHGVPTTVPLLAAFLAACVIQVVGGALLLLRPQTSGIAVSAAGMLLCAPFWWGFDLPLAWLNSAIVTIFLVLGWMFGHLPRVS